MAYALEMKARLQAVDMHEAVVAAAADGGLHIDSTNTPFAAPITDVVRTTPYTDAAPNTYLFDCCRYQVIENIALNNYFSILKKEHQDFNPCLNEAY